MQRGFNNKILLNFIERPINIEIMHDGIAFSSAKTSSSCKLETMF